MQSLATLNLKVELSLYAQLCHKHYTDTDRFRDNQPGSTDEELFKHNNSIYKTIDSLLNVLVPIWKESSLSTFILDNTIKLKFRGDGHNIDYMQNYVLITFCLLNEDKKVLKPNYQY
ncbi:16594_t:CDS:2 [Cetraspora pellucida]|uniref:16594_t:CDS:1 n=1 Tax=Cetraspora pellucida TaxID=1433469 RepID=A0A9N9BKZ0_9GLOM|nr:16594_t:CDS:2 [Cetraspora pellucida]